MDHNSVIRMVAMVRITNAMLQILDAEKTNASFTLGELHQRIASTYGIDPSTKDFAFYNQHQFLTSLLAYLCLPAEKFYDELPEIRIDALAPGWGAHSLFFDGSLKDLVRRLRNAVSHGHVSINPELLFEFHDRDVVVVFNHVNLHKFCQALAYWLLTKDVALEGL